MKNEPLITVGGITAAAAALLTCLVAFGVPLSDGQQTALIGLVGVLAPLAVAIFARSRVTPVK